MTPDEPDSQDGTVALICYDVDELQGHSVEQLLLQVCYRLDRHFPGHSEAVYAADYAAKAKAAIEAAAADLVDLYPELAAAVSGIAASVEVIV